MKVEKPNHMLKSVTNKELPNLSGEDLTILFDGDIFMTANGPGPPCGTFAENAGTSLIATLAGLEAVQQEGNMPNHDVGSLWDGAFRVPMAPPVHRIRSTPKRNNTPKLIKKQSTPPISRSYRGLCTPKHKSTLEDITLQSYSPSVRTAMTSIPLTPHLYNLCSSSPSVSNIPIDALSTPALFPSRLGTGTPDLLQLIDSDGHSVDKVENKLSTYGSQTLSDENVASYILELTDDYNFTSIQMPKPVKTSVKPVRPVTQRKRKGRFGKRMSEELLKVVKEEQKEKEKERRNKRRIKKQNSGSTCQTKKNGNGDLDNLKRKVKTCGRRTRSLVKACKDMGLASNEEEINALFIRPSPTDHEQDRENCRKLRSLFY